MTTKICTQKTGGKGNLGMYIERDNKICAAGKPTAQPKQSVRNSLEEYSLQDTVNALIGDALQPMHKLDVNKVSLKSSQIKDMRNAGIFGEGSELINPPVKTKFQTLVEDFKTTAYNSYWKKEVGKIPDPAPSLPQGYKIYDTTAGKKNLSSTNLYEIIMPVRTMPDKTPASKEPGYQTKRNYCAFNPNSIFGKRSNSDSSGNFLKCCLTYDKIFLGTALKEPIGTQQANFQNASSSRLGVSQTPNNNINCVPEGFTFGKVIPNSDNFLECLVACQLNPFKEQLRNYLGHLNTLRKCLSKRYDGTFFDKFYSCLKFLDDSKSGWLKKEIIYHQCNIRYIRFNPSLIEPLLHIWNAYDGSQINYKIFINVINYRIPTPDLPRIQDMPENFLDYHTTYDDIGNNKYMPDKQKRAGMPSGRYFDKDYPATPEGLCKADRSYFPEESDMKSCICPSIFTLLGISHRDMHAKRDSINLRKLFENAGEQFDDESFKKIWGIAEKYHSQGWVCYETFRQAIIEYKKAHMQKVT